MFKELEEKKLTSKEYYRNSFLHVVEDQVSLPDGNEAARVVVAHPGGVNLIALDQENKLLLVEQFRYALGMATYETPAGKREPGEENKITARRELEEETGYTCKNLKSLGQLATSPGFCTEFIENFLAENLEKLTEIIPGDDDEFINLHAVTKEEALALIESGKICDFKTIYAIQYLILHKGW